MRLLLDTHAFIWWVQQNPRLSKQARSSIESASVVFVSVVSAWEIATKQRLGRLAFGGKIEDAVADSSFDRLLVAFERAAAVATPPRHHNDPVDRMLIVQAQLEGLTIITHDRRFRSYTVPIVMT
jgi:PIN domain nuclease of toxin-antitoxin system